jgi:agmatinase
VADRIGPQNLVQIGIRSGPEDEFDWMRTHRTLFQQRAEVPVILDRLAGKPVFLTIDLDVLDPSILPGTGTPEPGGMQYSELLDWLVALSPLRWVGADVVELSPHYDPTGVSSVVGAKTIREVLILLNRSANRF